MDNPIYNIYLYIKQLTVDNRILWAFTNNIYTYYYTYQISSIFFKFVLQGEHLLNFNLILNFKLKKKHQIKDVNIINIAYFQLALLQKKKKIYLQCLERQNFGNNVFSNASIYDYF